MFPYLFANFSPSFLEIPLDPIPIPIPIPILINIEQCIHAIVTDNGLDIVAAIHHIQAGAAS